ncbi:PHP domain-containing protein [uncultured Thermanaerothrix sp.]|uniref:PHP domain-containing protein n=1 Tax=uncultured Thermanaerothrix sp. TaxID=1195149 RepID=UPI00261CBE3D|nr:PHP domain-containing protein [uncultured Thermanaerothrix sp.]
MTLFRADLHVHTVLSPCAELEMLPPLIVTEALERGISLIAITDHNATANIAAVQAAATGTPLTVLPGMELQTREDIHVLCLFDTLEQAHAWQAIVDQALPPLKNRPDYFGDQLIVDQEGDFVAREERLLLVATSFSLEEAWQKVTELGGLFIPAHVDRKTFGLIETLGFVPPTLPVDALEISRHLKPRDIPTRLPHILGYPLIQSGDVHRLDEFLGSTLFEIEAPTLTEIRMALRGENGRSCRILSATTIPSNVDC